MKKLKLLVPVAVTLSMLFMQACGKKQVPEGTGANVAAAIAPLPYPGGSGTVAAGQYVISQTSGPSLSYYWLGTSYFQWLSYPNPAYVNPGDTLVIQNDKDPMTGAIGGSSQFAIPNGTHKFLVNVAGYLSLGIQIQSGRTNKAGSTITVMRCIDGSGQAYTCP